MAGNAEKLYEEWSRCTPKNADFEDVHRVALHYFGPDSVRAAQTGSHQLIIGGEFMRLACRVRDGGYSDLAWLDGNTLSIPSHKGQKVKSCYVNELVKLISFKLEIQKVKSK